MCLAVDYQECFECLISLEYTVKYCIVIGRHSVVAVGKCWCLLGLFLIITFKMCLLVILLRFLNIISLSPKLTLFSEYEF